jgi:TatD DNase family protein
MQPKLIDIHAHLNFVGFGEDASEVLQKTLAQNVWVINVGADLVSSISAVEMANKYREGAWATVGLHPTEVGDVSEADWKKLEELARDEKVVAIGECGLEFPKVSIPPVIPAEAGIQVSLEDKKRQINIFKKHIELALELDKPLMIHCRDAYEDTYQILKEYKDKFSDKLRGNMHFFAGSLEQAKQFVGLDFTLSFTGVITFSEQYDEVVEWLPNEMIMAETDAPYVAPVPYRGKRNEPLYVEEVVKKMADLRGLIYDEMAKLCVVNAKRVFKI